MIPDYQKSFCNNIKVVEHNGRNFGIKKIVVALTLDGQTPPIDMADATQ